MAITPALTWSFWPGGAVAGSSSPQAVRDRDASSNAAIGAANLRFMADSVMGVVVVRMSHACSRSEHMAEVHERQPTVRPDRLTVAGAAISGAKPAPERVSVDTNVSDS